MVKRIAVILFFLCSTVKAQDIHFTQWMFSPLNLNPGETGRFDGDFRVVGNYRSQWGAVMEKQYKTFGLSYDQAFSVYGKQFSGGIQFDNDRSSIGNLMQCKNVLNLLFLTFKMKFLCFGKRLKVKTIRTGIITKPNLGGNASVFV